MASSERRDTADLARKACIVCKAFQPRDGKFLSCMHIICAGCLNECKNRDGSISCSICKSSTSAKIAGVDLSTQLASSALFWNEDNADKSDQSPVAGGTIQSDNTAFCDSCIDNDVQEEASHLCEDCDLPFCNSHVEKHLKKRAYSGHRVRALRWGSSASAPSQRAQFESKHCMFHGQCNVVTFCQTCCLCICVECIAVGSHEGHQVGSLASAAEEQRSVVTEVLKETGLGGNVPSAAAATNIEDAQGTTIAAEELLEAVQNDITMVTEEARAASQTTTEIFDEIEKIVKRERERALTEIDQHLWKQLDPLEGKKQRLDCLLNRQATVMEVATGITSPRSSDVGVLQVASTVVENLLEVSTDLREERDVNLPSFLFVKPANLNGIKDLLKRTAQIHDGVRIDISKSTVEVPVQGLLVGHEGRVVVKLADSTGRFMPSDQPVPEVKAEIILPSGVRRPANASSLDSDSSRLVIPICAYEPGDLTLELAIHGTSCRFKIKVMGEVSFNPSESSSEVVLSNDNHVATLRDTVDDKIGCAVATHEFTAGRHEWSMKVINGDFMNTDERFFIGVGESPMAWDENDESVLPKILCWRLDGIAVLIKETGQEQVKPAKMQPIQNGDVLQFTLDYDAREFQCVNKRTLEAKKFTDIDCTHPQYPSVCMGAPGQCVEIRSSFP